MLNVSPDNIYINTAKEILFLGEKKGDRTGTGTISLFSPSPMRFDLTEGFPLLTTKEVNFENIVRELLWFLQGTGNTKYLNDHNVNIWNKDAYRDYKEKGGELSYKEFRLHIKKEGYDLGPIYGKQWINWGEEGINQIQQLVYSIKNNPNSRRHIVTAWNPSDVKDMALPPCHILFQAYVSNDGGLSIKLHQRSGDFFLGVPYNIASYALLTHLIALETGLYAKEFIHDIGDAHFYLNHLEQIEEQIQRSPFPSPTLKIDKKESIFDYTYEDFELINYQSHGPIKGEMST